MSEYQYELDKLDFALKRHSDTVAGLESLEHSIRVNGRVTLADMQTMAHLVPNVAYPSATSVAGLCSNDNEAEVVAALEAINWKKVGLLGLIAAIIGAIIALIARIRGNSKNVKGVVEKAAMIPKQVDKLEKQIEKDIRQAQADVSKEERSDRNVQVILPSDNPMVEDGYGGYITQVEQSRRMQESEAQQKRRNEAAKANRKDEYGSLAGSGPLPFGKNKPMSPPKADGSKMAKIAKQFEQRFPHYGKVSTSDISTMLGISEGQLTGSESVQLDAVLSGLMDNVDKFMIERMSRVGTKHPKLSGMAENINILNQVRLELSGTETDYQLPDIKDLGQYFNEYAVDLFKLAVNTRVSKEYDRSAPSETFFEIIDSMVVFDAPFSKDFPGCGFEADKAMKRGIGLSDAKYLDFMIGLIKAINSEGEPSRVLNNPIYKHAGSAKVQRLMWTLKPVLNWMGNNFSPDAAPPAEVMDRLSDGFKLALAFKERRLEIGAVNAGFSPKNIGDKAPSIRATLEDESTIELISVLAEGSAESAKELDSALKGTETGITVNKDGLIDIEATRKLYTREIKEDYSNQNEGSLAFLCGKWYDPKEVSLISKVQQLHNEINMPCIKAFMGCSKLLTDYITYATTYSGGIYVVGNEYLAMVEFFRNELMKK